MVKYLRLDDTLIRYYKVKAKLDPFDESVDTYRFALFPEELLKEGVVDIEREVYFGPRHYIHNELFDIATRTEALLKSIALTAQNSICEEDINRMKDLLQMAEEQLGRAKDLIEVLERELWREEKEEIKKKEEEKLKLLRENAKLKRQVNDLKLFLECKNGSKDKENKKGGEQS